MVAHLVGAADAGASMRELVHQARLGRTARPGEPGVDGMNAVQVRERGDRDRPGCAATSPPRARAPSAGAPDCPPSLRAMRVPFGPPLGTKPLGYLMDCIYTRDAWMHRIDISRATGRALRLTADHDGRIVADVVAEWARGHGQPYRLTLTGPAGGIVVRGRRRRGAHPRRRRVLPDRLRPGIRLPGCWPSRCRSDRQRSPPRGRLCRDNGACASSVTAVPTTT